MKVTIYINPSDVKRIDPNTPPKHGYSYTIYGTWHCVEIEVDQQTLLNWDQIQESKDVTKTMLLD